MTREEVLNAYEEALERASIKHREACEAAREWCLRKLKEARQLEELATD